MSASDIIHIVACTLSCPHIDPFPQKWNNFASHSHVWINLRNIQNRRILNTCFGIHRKIISERWMTFFDLTNIKIRANFDWKIYMSRAFFDYTSIWAFNWYVTTKESKFILKNSRISLELVEWECLEVGGRLYTGSIQLALLSFLFLNTTRNVPQDSIWRLREVCHLILVIKITTDPQVQ